jgi:hypothetical protein
VPSDIKRITLAFFVKEIYKQSHDLLGFTLVAAIGALSCLPKEIIVEPFVNSAIRVARVTEFSFFRGVPREFEICHHPTIISIRNPIVGIDTSTECYSDPLIFRADEDGVHKFRVHAVDKLGEGLVNEVTA